VCAALLTYPDGVRSASVSLHNHNDRVKRTCVRTWWNQVFPEILLVARAR